MLVLARAASRTRTHSVAPPLHATHSGVAPSRNRWSMLASIVRSLTMLRASRRTAASLPFSQAS